MTKEWKNHNLGVSISNEVQGMEGGDGIVVGIEQDRGIEIEAAEIRRKIEIVEIGVEIVVGIVRKKEGGVVEVEAGAESGGKIAMIGEDDNLM